MLREITDVIQKAVGGECECSVEIPENSALGHYATNAAFRLAATRKRPPLEIAKELATRISAEDKSGFFERVEVAPPGFINFWLSRKTLFAELRGILKSGAKYGNSRIGAGRKIQLEFVSANPTGPLTLANGRGGFLGDALSAVLSGAGFKVEREYYVNDTGNQILVLGKSLLAAGRLAPDEPHFYKGSYIGAWAKRNKSFLKKSADNPFRVGQKAAKDFLSFIKKTLEKGGVRFDRWTSEENHIHKKGYVKKALEIFKKSGFVYEKDGALWLKTTSFGDDKDRVLVTKDGFTTYFLGDAGHYLETKKRGFSKKINILGPDHYGYVRRIQAAAKIVGLEDSVVLITQAVRLMRGGKEVKMSKRSGQFVTFEELLEEVNVDAARFFFLMHAPEAHMDFNLDLAKEKSLKNPVYYVQYAYVRTKSILRKAGSIKRRPALGLLNSESEAELIRKLIQLPDVILKTAEDYRAHRLPEYALAVARALHNFYEKERVIGEDKDTTSARLALVSATRSVLERVLRLMGAGLPDKM